MDQEDDTDPKPRERSFRPQDPGSPAPSVRFLVYFEPSSPASFGKHALSRGTLPVSGAAPTPPWCSQGARFCGVPCTPRRGSRFWPAATAAVVWGVEPKLPQSLPARSGGVVRRLRHARRRKEPEFSPGQTPSPPPACARSPRGGGVGTWTWPAGGRWAAGPGAACLPGSQAAREAGEGGGALGPRAAAVSRLCSAPARTSLWPRRPASLTRKAEPWDPALLAPGAGAAGRRPGSRGALGLGAPSSARWVTLGWASAFISALGAGTRARGSPGRRRRWRQVAAQGPPGRGVGAGVDALHSSGAVPDECPDVGSRGWGLKSVGGGGGGVSEGGDEGQRGRPGRCGDGCWWRAFEQAGDPHRLKVLLKDTPGAGQTTSPSRRFQTKTSFPLSVEGGDRQLALLPPSGGLAWLSCLSPPAPAGTPPARTCARRGPPVPREAPLGPSLGELALRVLCVLQGSTDA